MFVSSRIQESLLHALHASPANWPTLIQNHALHLLRSGEIHTFPQLMTQVLEDIRLDSVTARASLSACASRSTPSHTAANGTSSKAGSGTSATTAGMLDLTPASYRTCGRRMGGFRIHKGAREEKKANACVK